MEQFGRTALSKARMHRHRALAKLLEKVTTVEEPRTGLLQRRGDESSEIWDESSESGNDSSEIWEYHDPTPPPI